MSDNPKKPDILNRRYGGATPEGVAAIKRGGPMSEAEHDASAESLARAIFRAATPPDPPVRTGGHPSQDDNADSNI